MMALSTKKILKGYKNYKDMSLLHIVYKILHKVDATHCVKSLVIKIGIWFLSFLINYQPNTNSKQTCIIYTCKLLILGKLNYLNNRQWNYVKAVGSSIENLIRLEVPDKVQLLPRVNYFENKIQPKAEVTVPNLRVKSLRWPGYLRRQNKEQSLLNIFSPKSNLCM